MTSTVLPSMALSIASCTRCSLSASRALVAWGEGGGEKEQEGIGGRGGEGEVHRGREQSNDNYLRERRGLTTATQEILRNRWLLCNGGKKSVSC